MENTLADVRTARTFRGAFLATLASSLSIASLLNSAAAASNEWDAMDAALARLSDQGRFSGAVVVRGAEGVLFAQGYGFADPFARRRFTPDTPVDSASLAKPVTAAAVLLLVKDGKVDLDAPVRRYLPGYPHDATTVRHLLAHSAGLPTEEALEPLANKTNEVLMNEVRERRMAPLFAPGTGFTYCNLCYTTLALLTERVTEVAYLAFTQSGAALPTGVTIRPLRLADWHERAIGYRRTAEGTIERADSYEDEAFYGTANLSISAAQLAEWGTQWWQPQLASIRSLATQAARIEGRESGLTWGNWYCAPRGQRCHYLGHHEGFHHMLYWDTERRLSVAMVSNNTLAPGLQQRLQRALVAFMERRAPIGLQELAAELPDNALPPGNYRFSAGDTVLVPGDSNRISVEHRGIRYPAYRIGTGIRYVPGLDAYLAAAVDGRLHWLTLYEDTMGEKR